MSSPAMLEDHGIDNVTALDAPSGSDLTVTGGAVHIRAGIKDLEPSAPGTDPLAGFGLGREG